MYYEISASVERQTEDGYTSVRALPTFYLHASVQGIVSVGHAQRIAEHMLRDTAGPDARLRVYAATVS
jgi:hypothetical protein